ncbi:MAG: CBS domain-containing protein [Bacteroidetes bacterium]|nr:CBS domain-containing protein [Bacteroidota bacterium]
MHTVAGILHRKKRNPVSVAPDMTVTDALQLMADQQIGSVVVLQDNSYLGIMTERDYSRKVILKGKHSVSTTVAEIMSTDLPSVSPSDTVEHCMQLMSDKNIRYMPVFDSNGLAGIISMSDIVKEIILMQKDTISHLQSYIQQ